jgi:hypothetical protein
MRSAPRVQIVALVIWATASGCSPTQTSPPGSSNETSPSTECDQQGQTSIKKVDPIGEKDQMAGYKGALLVGRAESGPCTPLLGRRLAEMQAELWSSPAALVQVSVSGETQIFNKGDISTITPEVWTYRFTRPQGDSQLYVSMNRRGIQRVSQDDGAYDPRRFPPIGREWKRDVNASGPVLRAVATGQSVWIRQDFDIRVDGRRIPRGRAVFDAATGNELDSAAASGALQVLDAQNAPSQEKRE